MQQIVPDFLLADRYRLREPIAAGGMGEVWLVDDERLMRPVAVKIMRPGTIDEMVMAKRFREEALIGARLTHPNIVAVHDFGEDGSLAYLVMEYVPGRTLAQVLRAEGPMDADRVRSLMLQVGSALGATHRAGIIHRDVKPGNVLLMDDGTAKLTDFGIARGAHAMSLTMTGEVLGTPHYLSPEQALGRAATPASDIYALGVIAHELLTGAKPFDAETPVATVLAHAHAEPPPLPLSTPTELARVIRECLAKDIRHRPVDGTDLVARLEAMATPSQPVRSPATPPRLPARPAAASVPAVRTPAPPVPPPVAALTDAGSVAESARPAWPPTGRAYAVSGLVLALFLALIGLISR